MRKYILSNLFIICFSVLSIAQTGIIKGRVYDELTNEALPFANVVILGTTIGIATDLEGNYILENLTPGVYNIEVTFLGYKSGIASDIAVSNNAPTKVDFALVEEDSKLEEIEIKTSAFKKNEASPVSLNSIGVSEIQRSPGGNRDISKVIQTLPGVATGVSFRNDLLVRGGAPNENRFYLDGIEVPNINHFVTQGASGGSNGLINVDFIKNVDFYSGAFPANRGNTLSSLLEFQQKDGRTDRIGLTGTIGASDVGLTLEGPLAKKSNFLLSARVSYLQWLFKALQLPFLPTYVDGQFRSFHRFNDKHDLTFIGLGAFDHFVLNTGTNETEEQQYFLGVLPYQDQWNYTVGARYRYYTDKGYFTIVASRNQLGNKIFKYQNNENSNPDALIYDYNSRESENKLRAEHTLRKGGYKINYGLNYEYARYFNASNIKNVEDGAVVVNQYKTKLGLNKYGLFAQVSKSYANEKIGLSLGARMDGTNYNSKTANPFTQFSPRFSFSYSPIPGLSFNANTGIYYQLPAYTTLGFQDNNVFVNKINEVKYIRNIQGVFGAAYTTDFNAKVSVEGFYKKYDFYPLLVKDGISLANLGGDFGVVGAEEVVSASEGKAYGVEFLFQQKLYKGFYGIFTYTFHRSLFTDVQGDYSPSAWDNKHIITVVGGKRFPKNWEIGLRWTFYGGAPFTPYDVENSVLINQWNVNNEGLFDYSQLNTQRLKATHRLDIRVDKKWYFKNWNLDLYLDITNLYNNQAAGQDALTVVRNEDGIPIENPENPGSYIPNFIENNNGTLIPTIGVVFTY
jgi:hypothetical protein